MALNLEALTIQRIAVNTIPKRNEGRIPATPIYASLLTTLNQSGLDVFQNRITSALGKRSHGVELTIVDSNHNSFMQQAAKLMYMNDADYLLNSRVIATRLADVQASLDLAASKLIIIDGRIGEGQHRFLAVIKADLQDGFRDDNVSGAALLQNLFLTPTQRLYKIGFLEEVIANPNDEEGLKNSDDFRIHLFDHLITALETRNAAHYFYKQFLGADMLHSQKKITRDFYDLTIKYINAVPIDRDAKFDLVDALRSELKSNRTTIHSETFATDHMGEGLQQSYLDFLAQNNFNYDNFSKDTEFIKGKLKRRQRMRFSHGVEITTPADSLTQLVTIQESNAQRTILVINAAIESQE
ncbi:MAG: hypothetical protein BVN34_08340 [Proteobacteria bacterium ST_bin12]|nr:MAG: hypothetical protein BVN34_08340 [Proteobacteria bacterium ST_bin12]